MGDNGRVLRRAAIVALLSAFACEDGVEDAREAQIVDVMATADESIIRARPALAAGKYAKMGGGAYDFFRGTVPLYRSDLRTGATAFAASRFAMDLPLVPSLGDPHPENFGVLRATDGTIALEPNDFDAAEPEPYLWDVRRLAAGMALATTVAKLDAAAEEAVVSATMTAYRDGIEAPAPPPRIVPGMGGPIVDDVFRRSERDQVKRRELEDLTVIAADRSRHFKHGVLDPEEPQKMLVGLPPAAIAALPRALAGWRASLIVKPPPGDLALLDAVRILGSGVASWPRVRALLLLRGPTDAPEDDLIVELKEVADANVAASVPPTVYADSVGERIVLAARGAWARLDAEPFWGWTTWLGLPCQVRSESEGQKGVSVDRFVDELGTPEALAELGRALAGIVARMHFPEARAIVARIAIDREGFVTEQVFAGRSYAALAVADHARFVRALRRPDGMRLGVPLDPADAPSPDFAAVLGSPPPPPSLP